MHQWSAAVSAYRNRFVSPQHTFRQDSDKEQFKKTMTLKVSVTESLFSEPAVWRSSHKVLVILYSLESKCSFYILFELLVVPSTEVCIISTEKKKSYLATKAHKVKSENKWTWIIEWVNVRILIIFNCIILTNPVCSIYISCNVAIHWSGIVRIITSTLSNLKLQ